MACKRGGRCDTKSHQLSMAEERLPSGECPAPVPAPAVRRWQRRGAKRGRKPKERATHPPEPGAGKIGRMNASEPLAKASSNEQYPERMGTQDGEMRQMRHATAARCVCGHRGPGAERASTPIATQGCGTWKPCWGLVARLERYPTGQSADRKEGTSPQQDRNVPEANATARKGRGKHNPVDRATPVERPTPQGG